MCSLHPLETFLLGLFAIVAIWLWVSACVQQARRRPKIRFRSSVLLLLYRDCPVQYYGSSTVLL